MANKTDNNINVHKLSYINSSGKKVLESVTPDTIVLDMPFIMTCGKRLAIKMPYLKLEKSISGAHTAAIRLMYFDDADGIVSLNVQELATNKTYTLYCNMEYDGDYWLWCLTDLQTIYNLTK